jgi:hypothetical protein
LTNKERYTSILENYLKKHFWQFEFEVFPEFRAVFILVEIEEAMLLNFVAPMTDDLMKYFNLRPYWSASRNQFFMGVMNYRLREDPHTKIDWEALLK